MRFERVSFDEFCKYFENENAAAVAYKNIRLPQRGTPGSAGYDFYLPMNYCLGSIPTLIPTGVRVFLDPGYFLMCVPRSGLGFKYGMRLRNTTGVIDEDFVFGATEGHILAKVSTEESVSLHTGDRFMQGVLLKYGLTDDDSPLNGARVGGIGSTGGVS